MLFGRYTMYKVIVPEDIQKKLVTYYRDDIRKVGDLIGRDLSNWIG